MKYYATLSIGDTVQNPVENDPDHFLAAMIDDEPLTRTVRMIVERDLATDEKGYTKQVYMTNKQNAIVLLDGDDNKYYLCNLSHARTEFVGIAEVNDGYFGDKAVVYLCRDPSTHITLAVHRYGSYRFELPLTKNIEEARELLSKRS